MDLRKVLLHEKACCDCMVYSMQRPTYASNTFVGYKKIIDPLVTSKCSRRTIAPVLSRPSH